LTRFQLNAQPIPRAQANTGNAPHPTTVSSRNGKISVGDALAERIASVAAAAAISGWLLRRCRFESGGFRKRGAVIGAPLGIQAPGAGSAADEG